MGRQSRYTSNSRFYFRESLSQVEEFSKQKRKRRNRNRHTFTTKLEKLKLQVMKEFIKGLSFMF
jgi:hypothetical protein